MYGFYFICFVDHAVNTGESTVRNAHPSPIWITN